MSVSESVFGTHVPGARRERLLARVDVAAEARGLMAGLLAKPWGQVSASVYETGRVVSSAPWLSGHAHRVRFLLDSQRPDGGWGLPDGYDLVPTLSATEALLAELRRGGHPHPEGTGRGSRGDGHAPEPFPEPFPGPGARVLAEAAGRGLWTLRRRLGEWTRACLPDMPAIELIVPALASAIDSHLAPGENLQTPAGMDGAKLAAIRSRLVSGAAVPHKLAHALEVVGKAAAGAADVSPTPLSPALAGDGRAVGAIGASPAASAAWLGDRGAADPGDSVLCYLEAVAGGAGGPVPCATPVTVFERGWVLSWLLRAGIRTTVPASLTASLSDALGPGGTAAGPGLPPDADTTSVAFHALALLGTPLEPAGLWAYDTGTHFCTWQGEDGASPTVNAHVLDAFGEYLRRGAGPADPRYAAAVTRISAWLRDRQEPDGSWLDRWHASPYYATACCSIALADFGGPESEAAVRAAGDWVVTTQRPDGSWGRWAGTAEETAYALQTLLLAAGPVSGHAAGHDDARAAALERGHRSLLASITDRGEPVDAPPLWHDKDLYLPAAIVRAAVLGALHLSDRAASTEFSACPSSPDPSVPGLSSVLSGLPLSLSTAGSGPGTSRL
ncbi:prenyltransferase/squalene oxidase repeat-containing protein [Streptosporangium sp. NPDC023615]|uniref:prenyltransferase/squalene oxidase repeat-containing protein n=1 Tax=Streptosporangium sp. NPDC023615 TaxID=3154794 RepID=UPI00344710B5